MNSQKICELQNQGVIWRHSNDLLSQGRRFVVFIQLNIQKQVDLKSSDSAFHFGNQTNYVYQFYQNIMSKDQFKVDPETNKEIQAIVQTPQKLPKQKEYQKRTSFWSARLKHDEINIEGQLITRPELPMNINDDVLIMGNLVLSKNKPVYQWTLQLLENDSWIIYFGIMEENVAFNMNFDLQDQSQIGIKGAYFINCCTGTPIVCQKDCILQKSDNPLKHGQKLTINFQTNSCLLRFYGQNPDSRWVFKVEPLNLGNQYRPCVSLWPKCSLKFCQNS